MMTWKQIYQNITKVRMGFIMWWHHRGQFALICNFRTEDRRRIALFAFQKHTGFYGPRYGNVNFKTVEKGTLWQCELQMTRTGRCTWVRAKQVKKEEK